MDAVTDEEISTGGGVGDDNNVMYLVVGLAVGIPCGVIILVLFLVIMFIIYLTFQSSRSDFDDVEATYMRQRFRGLSLEEQRRMAEKDKHKKKRRDRIHTRRSSSATESSVELSPYSRRARVRKNNPFGLQDWQLKMTGIDVSPNSDETDFDNDATQGKSPIGALNPLMLEDESNIDYEAAPDRQKSSPNLKLSEEDVSSSSDSMNPYD